MAYSCLGAAFLQRGVGASVGAGVGVGAVVSADVGAGFWRWKHTSVNIVPRNGHCADGYSGARTSSDLYCGRTGLHGINRQMN